MERFAPHLAWIDARAQRMAQRVAEWAEINSGTWNAAGVNRIGENVRAELQRLDCDVRTIELPPQEWVEPSGETSHRSLGHALHATKRSGGPLRVLLAIHLDTVYPVDDPFQHATRLDENTLRGPGVADAKGGLIVLLTALEALERSPFAGRVRWEVLLNPDEEIGSPASSALFVDAAQRNDVGLLFEPALPDGTLAGARKGSGNFTAVVTGRSAHAGRDPQAGRNAIHALAEFVVGVAAINNPRDGVIANVGRIEGGTAPNVVPDRAVCRFNLRVDTIEQQRHVDAQLAALARQIDQREGYTLRLTGGFTAPPKPLDTKAMQLFEHVATCGRDLGMTIQWRSTGGVCDGNRLAAAGLPNVDTMGPRGGNLHSAQEFLLLDSLVERAKLTALVLMRMGEYSRGR